MSVRRSPVAARRVKTLSAVLALLVAVTLPSAPTAAAEAAPIPASFVVSGSGWGHGVGLSQYGARGQANEGRNAAQILSHYYTGTTVGALADNMNIRVQVHRAVTLTANTTGGQMRLHTGANDARLVPAGKQVSFAVVGTQVRASYGTAVLAGTTVYVEWDGTRFYNPTGPAALTTVTGSGGVYRHGRLEMGVLTGQVNAVNVLRLHGEYLYGIGEMPSSWAPAALDAQAIIARGYGLANMGSLKSDCNCNVYDSVKSQHFTGWSKENETVGATNYGKLWQAAVNRTSVGSDQGKVVEYQGKLATTYYFSSSGGRTQNSEDVWVTAVPYLRSVPDPWSLDPLNNPTYAEWTRAVSQSAMAAAFGLTNVASIDLSQRTTGGGMKSAVATSATGATVTLKGELLRTRLGLPSSWVRRPAIRVAGADRWSTAVEVARRASPTGRTVVIVSGQDANLVDGLVAGPLAHSLGAPVLLVGQTMPPATRAELKRRSADHAIIVGGTGAVPQSVATDLGALGIAVERVSGTDRYATAAAVAIRVGAPSKAAIVASGDSASLADALSVSGPASALRRPIVLVQRDSVPAATSTALQTLGVTATTCIGGAGVISEAVRTALPTCSRAAGANRWETSVAVANAFSGLVPATKVTVTGGRDANLVDALGAGSMGQIVLLVPPTAPPASVVAWLQKSYSILGLEVVGGTGAVPDVAVQGMRNA